MISSHEGESVAVNSSHANSINQDILNYIVLVGINIEGLTPESLDFYLPVRINFPTRSGCCRNDMGRGENRV